MESLLDYMGIAFRGSVNDRTREIVMKTLSQSILAASLTDGYAYEMSARNGRLTFKLIPPKREKKAAA